MKASYIVSFLVVKKERSLWESILYEQEQETDQLIMPIFSSYVGGLSEVDVKIEQSVLACSSAASKIENNPQHTENNSEIT